MKQNNQTNGYDYGDEDIPKVDLPNQGKPSADSSHETNRNEERGEG